MQTIGSFNLANNGGFVCAGKVSFIDPNGGTGTSDRWAMIPLGQNETMKPADRGVPGGALVQTYIDIVAGNDRTGGTYFLYDPSSPLCANYSITGTTLNSAVHFGGVTPIGQ